MGFIACIFANKFLSSLIAVDFKAVNQVVSYPSLAQATSTFYVYILAPTHQDGARGQ